MKSRTFIYVVKFETGEVSTLSHIFNGTVKQITVESDEKLYMCLTKKLPEKGPVMEDDEYELGIFPENYIKFRYLRVPIGLVDIFNT